MAIDARIDAVENVDDGYLLHLQATIRDDGYASIPGQRRLLIINPTHRPHPGQTIWGGSDSVIIEPGFGIEEQRHYRRVGYTKLEEAD